MIDCDVHSRVPSTDELLPYLDQHWREYVSEIGVDRFGLGLMAPSLTHLPGLLRSSVRASAELRDSAATAQPKQGGREYVTERHRTFGEPSSVGVPDVDNVEYAIVNCYMGVEGIRNPDLATAVARAVNDWLISEWLEKEPRLRASLVVPVGYPQGVIEEIDRLGDHPGFVQILLPVRSERPYGNRQFHPIYEAAARKGLAVCLHFGGYSENPPTPNGWASHYLEEYVTMCHAFQTQVTSLVFEGVFNRCPALRVVLAESGVSWLPSLMWRLDKEWRGLRRETPWVEQAPSAYIRKHMRATTQPLDAPAEEHRLLGIVEQIGTDEFFLFASDYPRAHPESAQRAFLRALPESSRTKVLTENALAFYGMN